MVFLTVGNLQVNSELYINLESLKAACDTFEALTSIAFWNWDDARADQGSVRCHIYISDSCPLTLTVVAYGYE